MKHLRLFKTEAEYNSATLELPNVSYVEETKIVGYKSNKPEVIEYHFEIPMEEVEDWFGNPAKNGTLQGDYSDLHENLYKFATKYGQDIDGCFLLGGDEFEKHIKITVNGDTTNELNVYYSGDNKNYTDVTDMDMITNGIPTIEAAKLWITPTSISYTCGI